MLTVTLEELRTKKDRHPEISQQFLFFFFFLFVSLFFVVPPFPSKCQTKMLLLLLGPREEKWWGRNLSGRDSLGNALWGSRWGEKDPNGGKKKKKKKKNSGKTTKQQTSLGSFFGHKNNNSHNLQRGTLSQYNINMFLFFAPWNANQCRLIPRLGVLILYYFFFFFSFFFSPPVSISRWMTPKRRIRWGLLGQGLFSPFLYLILFISSYRALIAICVNNHHSPMKTGDIIIHEMLSGSQMTNGTGWWPECQLLPWESYGREEGGKK